MAQQGRLINVRVAKSIGAAIDERVALTGATLSDVVRELIEGGLKMPATRERADAHRERADTLRDLAALATLLRRLGSAYMYAMKAHQPASEAEVQARIAAMTAIEAAVRRIV